MQKTILATLAVIASVATASASDLPSKKAPVAPVVPVFSQASNYYVGLNAGGLGSSSSVYSGGVVAGWNALPFLAVEGAYVYNYDDNKDHGRRQNTHTVSVNALPQYHIGSTPVTVYALAGVGYRWDAVTADHSIYNLGAGAKYAVSKDVDVDARYTRTTATDTSTYPGNEDRFSVGLNVKF